MCLCRPPESENAIPTALETKPWAKPIEWSSSTVKEDEMC